MILKKYLEQAGISQRDFAESVGVTEGRVSQLIGGDHTPSFGLAAMIESATGGKVRMQDWTLGGYDGDVLERREKGRGAA